MKKVIVMGSVLFIFALGVLGYYFLDSKNNQDKELYEINEKQVDMIDGIALDDIHINDVIISNIRIVDNKTLKFEITATKTDLKDKMISIILYNDFTKSPGISLSVKYSDLTVDKENANEYSIDIKESYNNPYRIEFDVR